MHRHRWEAVDLEKLMHGSEWRPSRLGKMAHLTTRGPRLSVSTSPLRRMGKRQAGEWQSRGQEDTSRCVGEKLGCKCRGLVKDSVWFQVFEVDASCDCPL